jgi:D-amino peptidase
MRILIAADMEGVSGVTHWDQVSPGNSEYRRFRELMTEDVNAAIQGAREAGADDVLVADGHAYGRNILIEKLDSQARLNSGSPSDFAMIQGIDNSIDGVMMIGYHARAGTPHAILDHTWSSSTVANLWINEIVLGETGLNAAVCGHFEVPVIMVSGDQAVCAEALDLLGKIEVAVVKKAAGRMAAECLPPAQAQDKICEAAARAVTRLRGSEKEAYSALPPPFQMGEPFQVEVELVQSQMADRAALLPGARRMQGKRVQYQAEDMLQAYRAFRSMVALSRD